jgi:hypothetical protein
MTYGERLSKLIQADLGEAWTVDVREMSCMAGRMMFAARATVEGDGRFEHCFGMGVDELDANIEWVSHSVADTLRRSLHLRRGGGTLVPGRSQPEPEAQGALWG